MLFAGETEFLGEEEIIVDDNSVVVSFWGDGTCTLYLSVFDEYGVEYVIDDNEISYENPPTEDQLREKINDYLEP